MSPIRRDKKKLFNNCKPVIGQERVTSLNTRVNVKGYAVVNGIMMPIV